MIKEYPNILNKKEKDFLKKAIVNSSSFSFYLNTSDVDSNFKFNNPKLNYFPFFTHTVLLRPEQSDNANKESRIHSNTYNFFTDLFSKLSKRCKFKYEEIFRININLTFNNGKEKSHVHVDHYFPHKQLILYLHSDDLNACTCIVNKKNKKIKKIKPSPNKAVVFDGELDHYHIVPKKGYRVVLIYTFK